jgi:hypothetical protein
MPGLYCAPAPDTFRKLFTLGHTPGADDSFRERVWAIGRTGDFGQPNSQRIHFDGARTNPVVDLTGEPRLSATRGVRLVLPTAANDASLGSARCSPCARGVTSRT